MANLFSILFIILVAIVGGIPTIVITGYIPVMIAQKIYRKVKYGYLLESDRNSHPKASRINQSESDRNSQS
mgnify:CR=1 FL=1